MSITPAPSIDDCGQFEFEPGRPGVFRRAAALSGRVFDRVIGFISMTLCLAVVSVFPVLNLLSLGYLLEASSRVTSSGRWRDGFVGIGFFSRLGKVALGVWLWTLPLRLIHSFWRDAELIEAGSEQANALRFLLAFLVVVISLHLLAAVIRGGKLRHFLLPRPFQWIRWIHRPESFPKPVGIFRSFRLLGRRLGVLGKLGLFGFLGAAVWLALPVAMLFASAQAGQQGVSLLGSFLGSILLGAVVLLIPFLQTRFAVTRDFRDFFRIAPVRRLFRRAPFAFWLALLTTLLFALPLYLLKIELTPREVAWLPNVIFVLFIFPARLLLGWALYRGETAIQSRRWPSRWLSGLLSIPVVAAYVFVVWLSQYLSWHGTYSLLEQHAFLVPAPLFGL